MTDTLDRALDGLEQLHAMIAADAVPPIARTLDFSVVEVEKGRAVFEGKPDIRVYNAIGSVHGGYAATLLDTACGVAVHSKLAPGYGYTTLELKISYLRGMTVDTGVIRAEGVVVSMGRRVAFAEAKITDAEGTLLATATSTLLVIAP